MSCSQKKLTIMYNRLHLYINSQVLTQFLVFHKVKTSTSALHSWLGNVAVFSPGQSFPVVKMEKAYPLHEQKEKGDFLECLHFKFFLVCSPYCILQNNSEELTRHLQFSSGMHIFHIY